MVTPDSLFGAFVLAVHHLRELQRVPLKEWSAAKAAALEKATAEVDSQLALFLARSVFRDEFSAVIDAASGGHN